MSNFPSKLGNKRDGLYRRNVKKMSTVSTARVDLKPEDSGTIYVFGTVSTVSVRLPRGSSKWLGLTYDIYFSTADAAGDYTITVEDSSAQIMIRNTTGGIKDAANSTITPASTDGPHAIRVTLISSVVWLGETLFNGVSTHNSTAASESIGMFTTA